MDTQRSAITASGVLPKQAKSNGSVPVEPTGVQPNWMAGPSIAFSRAQQGRHRRAQDAWPGESRNRRRY